MPSLTLNLTVKLWNIQCKNILKRPITASAHFKAGGVNVIRSRRLQNSLFKSKPLLLLTPGTPHNLLIDARASNWGNMSITQKPDVWFHMLAGKVALQSTDITRRSHHKLKVTNCREEASWSSHNFHTSGSIWPCCWPCAEVLGKPLISRRLCPPSNDGYLVEWESYIAMIGYSCSKLHKFASAELSPEEMRLYKREFQYKGCKFWSLLNSRTYHTININVYIHIYILLCLLQMS